MRRTEGLTLVELLATLAITGLLVAGSLRAVGSLGRSDRAGRSRYEDASRRAALERILEMDLTHARRFRATKTGFELQTWFALAGETLSAAHVPVRVAYEIETIHDRPWLQRRQTGSGSGPGAAELLLPDVVSIVLQTDTPSRRGSRDAWTGLSSTVIVEVRFDEDNQAVQTCTFLTD